MKIRPTTVGRVRCGRVYFPTGKGFLALQVVPKSASPPNQ